MTGSRQPAPTSTPPVFPVIADRPAQPGERGFLRPLLHTPYGTLLARRGSCSSSSVIPSPSLPTTGSYMCIMYVHLWGPLFFLRSTVHVAINCYELEQTVSTLFWCCETTSHQKLSSLVCKLKVTAYAAREAWTQCDTRL